MTQHYLMRLVRYGPLVPARLQYLDHEPGEPDNKRDRWPTLLCVVDIAGEDVEPEQLLDRFHWRSGHWKFAEPITLAEYRQRFEAMRWAEKHQPDNPVLAPRRKVNPKHVPLPSFARENAHS